MTGVTWQMDMGFAWITQVAENSDYTPNDIQIALAWTLSGGGVKGTRTIDVIGAAASFGIYGSGDYWSMYTDQGEIIEVVGVSGDTITLKSPLKFTTTTVYTRNVVVRNPDRIAKIYVDTIEENFTADIEVQDEKESDLGIHTFQFSGWSHLTNQLLTVTPYRWEVVGTITINGTTISNGIDFEVRNKNAEEAADSIISAINSDIPDVTGYREGKTVRLGGAIRSAGCTFDSLFGASYKYHLKFPTTIFSQDLKVSKTLRMKGLILSDEHLTAERYRNAIWNLTRLGWVNVYFANDNWEWYVVDKVNISRDFSSNVKYPRTILPHKINVYNYVLGAANNDTVIVNGTTLTEGADFNAVTSNDVTATNIAAAITSGVSGVAATASGNEVILSGTITRLYSSSQYSWPIAIGGARRDYKYTIDISFKHGPPKKEKQYMDSWTGYWH